MDEYKTCINCKYQNSELYEMPCIACSENPVMQNLFQPFDKSNKDIKEG